MTEAEALALMKAPGDQRPMKWRGSVIQILVTSSCNLACTNCTQGSQLRHTPWFMTPEQFEQAVQSLQGFQGVYGVFGGCPTLSPYFDDYCRILRGRVPREQCGLWANNLMGHGAACRITFDPAISNLNCHMDQTAHDEMVRDWPESRPFGLHQDSRHSPPYVAMKDVLKKNCPSCAGKGLEVEYAPDSIAADCEVCRGSGQVYDEERAWELISTCDVNQRWSALVGVFRGQLRAWFCEIAGAQSLLHQHEPDYPDTGIRLYGDGIYESATSVGIKRSLTEKWWEQPMPYFADQVRKHCHECSVPLRGYGELSQAPNCVEQTSATHAAVYRPKRKGRRVEVVTRLEQLGLGRIQRATEYLQNGRV